MKKPFFIFLFIAVHLMFILLHIYKNVLFTQELFKHQRLEKTLADLVNQQELKRNELFLLKNQEDIQTFARTTLGLQPLSILQIRRLS